MFSSELKEVNRALRWIAIQNKSALFGHHVILDRGLIIYKQVIYRLVIYGHLNHEFIICESINRRLVNREIDSVLIHPVLSKYFK